MHIHDLKELISVTGGELLFQGKEAELTRLTTDSREAEAGSLFIAIRGENTDGHRFLKSAAENGASALVISSKEAFLESEEALKNCASSVILVPDTVRALQKIGQYWAAKMPAIEIGVTGSVGKTTTREMIACALSAGKKVFRTNKNYNNRLGLPITLSEIPEEAEIAVLELGLNTPGELSEISRLTDLSAAVITNIGDAHLIYYGTREKLCREKFTVTDGFTDPKKQHLLFLNADDPFLMAEKARCPYECVCYGLSEEAAYRAEELQRKNGLYSFMLVVHGEARFRVQLNVPGEHNVRNALAALAVADIYGVPLQDAASALSSYTGYEGRLKQTEKNGILVVDDSYNASPASMKAGVKVLSELVFRDGKGRKIAVLGDMLELGEESPRLHEETGAACAPLPVDAYYLYGELGKEIGKGLQENGAQAEVFCFDAKEALKEAVKKAVRPGDIVYIKASHSTGLSVVGEALLQDHEG